MEREIRAGVLAEMTVCGEQFDCIVSDVSRDLQGHIEEVRVIPIVDWNSSEKEVGLPDGDNRAAGE